MGAAVGTEVGLYYDSPTRVDVGDFIRTQTGRVYRIVSVRIQQRGQHVGRQHLRAVVSVQQDIDPETDVVHALYWYSRNRRIDRRAQRRRVTAAAGTLIFLAAGTWYATTWMWIQTS